MDKAGKMQELGKLMDDINRSDKKKLKGRDRKIIFGKDLDPLRLEPVGIKDYDDTVGGEPRGRWTIDYGYESSGKSTWNYRKMASFQKRGMICAIIDAESGFDRDWATRQGVNVDELVVIPSQETFEDTCNEIRKLVKSNLIDFFLLDSIHGVPMRQEVYKKTSGTSQGKERNLDDDTTAAGARKIGQFIRIVTPALGKSDSMFTIIGQVREDIGSYGAGPHLSGGHQLLHHSSCTRVWRRAAKTQWPKEKKDGRDTYIGFVARVVVQKTKLNGNEGMEVYIPFKFGLGTDDRRVKVDYAIEKGIIEWPSAAWFKFGDDKINGRNRVYEYFEDDTKFDKLIKAIQEKEDEQDK